MIWCRHLSCGSFALEEEEGGGGGGGCCFVLLFFSFPLPLPRSFLTPSRAASPQPTLALPCTPKHELPILPIDAPSCTLLTPSSTPSRPLASFSTACIFLTRYPFLPLHLHVFLCWTPESTPADFLYPPSCFKQEFSDMIVIHSLQRESIKRPSNKYYF